MIQDFFEKLIEELGTTGVLVLGLYFLLYKPITDMSRSLKSINHELHRILDIIDDELSKDEK